jgi:hypothetical protein
MLVEPMGIPHVWLVSTRLVSPRKPSNDPLRSLDGILR